MRTIAIANQKGGVGKTTLTLLVGSALACRGRRVLVVDLDPQANATTAAAVARGGPTIADALLDRDSVPIAALVRPSVWGFDVVASDIGLAAKELHRRLADEYDLRDLLADVEGYDEVLLDCPPSLGVLTVGALTAADAVLIVAEAGGFALDGVDQLLDTVSVVRRHYNPALSIAGIVLNLVDHTVETRDQAAAALAAFGSAVLEPYVPRRVVVREAISRAMPLAAMGATRGAAEVDAIIDALAGEVTSRVR